MKSSLNDLRTEPSSLRPLAFILVLWKRGMPLMVPASHWRIFTDVTSVLSFTVHHVTTASRANAARGRPCWLAPDPVEECLRRVLEGAQRHGHGLGLVVGRLICGVVRGGGGGLRLGFMIG